MKRFFSVVAVYVAGMCACALLCLALNSLTPVLRDGDALPPDIYSRQALIDCTGMVGQKDCAFTFVATEDAPPLTLTVSDAGPFCLLFNGEVKHIHSEASPYSRNIPVHLGTPRVGENRVEIRMSGASRDGELLLGPSAVVKLLIGSQTAALQAEGRYAQIVALFVGVYVMLIFGCLALFVRRRQERYLFALVMVSLASMAVMLVDVYAPLFISQGVFASIRSSLFICPVIFTAAIGFYLMIDLIPERIRAFMTLGRLLLATAVIVVAQYFSRYNFNFALRAVLLALLIPLFYRAARRNVPGTLLLAAGYGLCDGARVFVYMINTLHMAPAGEWAIYLRITQLGYLGLLVPCMAIVLQRFADKFTQAERLNRTLDEQVDQRTAQLSEANARLKAAQEREREMMTHVLHDLRTPLFHLQGYVDMAADEQGWNPQLLDSMRERLQYVENLAENLFLTARLEGGRVSINRHMIDMTKICGDLASALEVAARDRGLTTSSSIAPRVRAAGDGFRVRQVLQNLLDNAVQYTPKGGWVRVQLEREGDSVRATVRNSAVIPPQELPHVFERFFHGSASGSSGLGLYIAKTLASQMGAELSVESGNGETAFALVLRGDWPREEGGDGP